MAIKIEMLRTFALVAQTGNLAEAGDRLGRSPSAVSMTLKQLEAHLGRPLFETDRKNRLTDLGEQVLDLALGQLRGFDETIAAIEGSARAPSGLIRIVSVPSVAALVIPAALERMHRRYPQVQIDLRDTDSRQVAESLSRGQADIGIASGPVALGGVRQIPLFEDRFGLVCAPSHPLARQQDKPDMDQLAGAGFIRNSLCDQITDPAFQQVAAAAGLTVHNTLSLMAMVEKGNGVTVLPQTVARLARGALVFRQIRGMAEWRHVTLALRDRARHHELAGELAELVAEEGRALFAQTDDPVPRSVAKPG